MNLKSIIALQAAVVIYTLSGVTAKFASGQPMFSVKFFLFYGLEVVILGIYAILWQQMIKRFDLSVAYANRAMAILWSALWAVILFHNNLTMQNMIGILLVCAGTVVINTDVKKGEKEDE